MNKYPRESGPELVIFDPVTINGETTGLFQWQLTEQAERPIGAWANPIAVDDEFGFELQPAPRGIYRVWVKIVAGGQTIVVLAGELERT